MSLSKESIKRLRAVKRAILAEPSLYNQRRAARDQMHNCGTPCCLSGWAVWLSNPNAQAYESALKRDGVFGSKALAVALGISVVQAMRLYIVWPSVDGPAWNNPGTVRAARDAADRIEHFIATGGAE